MRLVVRSAVGFADCCKGSVTDEADDGERVIRGGSFANQPRNLRCAYRNRRHATNRNSNQGFRVVSVRARST